MSIKITKFFLIMSVLLWGTWFGGQLFNEAMVIPKWLSAPPESMRTYDALPTKGGFFFFLINPFFTLFSLLAIFTGWKASVNSRKWLIATTIIGFIVSLVAIFYLAPLIHKVSAEALQNRVSSQQILEDVNRWLLGNRLRLVLEFFGFLFSVIALQTFNKDSLKARSVIKV